ncbi:hypothetical protein P8452_75576 [Trifolium repens]|nr:hypothetical protein P8452_75576 [Trifolium repens]
MLSIAALQHAVAETRTGAGGHYDSFGLPARCFLHSQLSRPQMAVKSWPKPGIMSAVRVSAPISKMSLFLKQSFLKGIIVLLNPSSDLVLYYFNSHVFFHLVAVSFFVCFAASFIVLFCFVMLLRTCSVLIFFLKASVLILCFLVLAAVLCFVLRSVKFCSLITFRT